MQANISSCHSLLARLLKRVALSAIFMSVLWRVISVSAAPSNIPKCTQMAKYQVFQNPDLLMHMVDMYPGLLLDVSRVCHDFKEAASSFDLGAMLAAMTGHAPFAGMKPGSELRQLFLLASITGKHFYKIFSLHSCIWPVSPITVDYALKVILENEDMPSYERSEYRASIASHLAQHGEFETLAHLFQVASDCHYSFNYCDFTAWHGYKLARVSQVSAQVLLKVHSRVINREVLSGILAAPVDVDILDPLLSSPNLRSRDTVYTALQAIGTSCRWQFEEFDPTRRAFMHERNANLIAKLEALLPVHPTYSSMAAYSRFLNDIKFSDASASELESKLDVLSSQTRFNFLTDDLIISMLIVAVNATQNALFSKILKSYTLRVYFDLELTRAIEQNPQFMMNMSLYDPTNAHFYKTSELEEARLQMQQVTAPVHPYHFSAVRCIATQHVLVAEFCAFDAFAAFVRNAPYGDPREVESCIVKLISEFDNPVPFVHAVLANITEIVRDAMKFNSISSYAKYVQTLLTDEINCGISLAELPKFELRITPGMVRVLLNDLALATTLSIKQSHPVRENIYICASVFELTGGLNSGDVLRLFEIIHVPIASHSFTVKSNASTRNMHRPSFDNDWRLDHLTAQAAKSGFLAHLAIFMRRCECDHQRFALYPMKRLDESNPCLLESFDIFHLWYWRNPDSFFNFAPPPVIRAFISRSAESVIQEISELGVCCERVKKIARVYLKNRSIDLIFSSDEEHVEFREKVWPTLEDFFDTIHCQVDFIVTSPSQESE